MANLFDRVAKIIIGISETDAIVYNEKFRITFDIRKDTTSLPNQATVSIFNLSSEEREKIKNIIHKNSELGKKKEPLLPLLLYAGYKENIGYEFLYSGNITAVIDKYGGTDIETQISTGDGLIPLRDTLLNLSFSAGVSVKSIVEQIASELKMNISSASDFINSNFEFANGFSFTGKAADAMDRVIKSSGLTWHIEKNQVVILPNDSSTKDEIILLNKSTGLIGAPEKIIESGINVINPGDYDGWDVKSLLRPEINPGNRIKIESRLANTVMTVRTLEHKGDSWSGDWFTNIQVRKLIV